MKKAIEISTKQQIDKQWKKILSVPLRETRGNLCRATKNESWQRIKDIFFYFKALYEDIGYRGYALTVKRGKGNSDYNDQIKVLSEVLEFLRKKNFKGFCPGLEFPILTFSGNAIDGSYNPHLHSLLFIPKSLESDFVACFSRKGKSYRVEELINGQLIRKRKEICLWINQAFEITSLLNYSGRLEDPTKGKNLDKVILDVTSFGFKSDEKQDKKSHRIYRRITSKFEISESSIDSKIKIFCMLHWISQQKNRNDFLREFIPPLESDSECKQSKPIGEILKNQAKLRNGDSLSNLKFRIKKDSKKKIYWVNQRLQFQRRDSGAVSV